MPFTENTYENSIIQVLEGLGYRHVYGPDFSERDYQSPLFEEELEESIRRINPSLKEGGIQDALHKLHHFENADLIQKNRLFMDYLQNGLPVRYRENGEQKSDICYLVDYDHPDRNSFVVANQWTFSERSNKRPDILIFLNGLPVVLMELKSPSREETSASEAYSQIRNYIHEIPSMFIYNAFCVMSDLLVSKAGTITSDEERFMEWKSKDGTYTTELIANFDVFFGGIFPKERLLDIIKNFICFSDEGIKTYKIMAAYHQYFAVNKAIKSTEKAVATDGKGGVFWHTQGSGKSLSMVFYAHLLQQHLDSPTIVVLTDRNDLDDQLFSQFDKCSEFLRQKPIRAESREHLIKLLDERKANGIFFTTIEKFTESPKPLSTRKNIVVMSDEAHRSQYGLTERVRIKKDENGNDVAVTTLGYARKVRDALPNATYIGFTGTPVFGKDRNTKEIFGDYIDIYDMTQSVADGATKPVYYESRVIKLKLDENTIRSIDDLYDELEEDTDTSVIEASKRKLGQLEAVLGNPETIHSLVTDIIDHYESYRENLLTGKAMIVAYSRPIAMEIYKEILRQRPSWTEKIAVVMTSDNRDPEWWREIIGNKAYKQTLATKFKDNSSPLKIAIVVDMWLTGFDIPSLATMYVYKPMAGHNLMQAIARVNRVFEDKEGGLVVDYIGIATALKQAMREYTVRDRKNFGDMDVSKEAYPKFQEKLQVCKDLFHGFDWSIFNTGDDLEKAQTITGAVNFMVSPELEETKKDFLKQALLCHQALSLCSSLATAKERHESSFFESVRVLLNRLASAGSPKKYSLSEVNDKVSELLKQSVISEGVINLFEDQELSFSLFNPDFLAEIAKMKEKNIAVELLKKLIREQIKIFRKTNLVQSVKFSEIIERIVTKYLNGMLTNEEVMHELLALAEQIRKATEQGVELGLTSEEKAFYDALTQPAAVMDFYTNDELVMMTKELTELLRKNETIDWQKREGERSHMKMLVKRLLKKYKYPPEGEEREKAITTVLEQCELWTDNVMGGTGDGC